MTNWFIIDISSLETPMGFYEFYFGTLTDSVKHFKERNASKTTFERLIHDRLAAELLRNGRPNYSLIFMVSTPMMVLETVDKQERSITPFIHYLKQELKTLSEFIGMPPTNTLIFEADNHFEALSLFKESTDAILNNLHFLDHTKKQTSFYKMGNSWEDSLKETLRESHKQSNLEGVLLTAPVFYFRVPIKNKMRTEVLHQFTTVKKGRFQELSFETNNTRQQIDGLVQQMIASLEKKKLSIANKEITADLIRLEENREGIEDKKQELSTILKSWKPDKSQLNNQTVKGKFKDWKNQFDQCLQQVDTNTQSFLNYLNNQYYVAKAISETQNGGKDFWEQRQTELTHKQANKNHQVKSYVFDREKSIADIKASAYQYFDEIEKDLKRCPNTLFLGLILFFSLLFYAIASYTVVFDYYIHWPFLLLTLAYIIASTVLFLNYRNKNIKKISTSLSNIEKIIHQKGAQLLEALDNKKSNQLIL